ncbi:MAG: 30S ribosomal protein S12 methylthiotransferase RimO [Planctomycetota bacterium]
MTSRPQWSAGPAGAPAIALASLGCPKNLVDSEVLAGMLIRAGFRVTSDLSEADVAVVNTCGFIADARRESVETILGIARRRREGFLRGLVVCGCLPQREGPALADAIPEVDAWAGVFEPLRVVEACRKILEGKPAEGFLPPGGVPDRSLPPDRGRAALLPPHTAYLRIADGCSHACTFCAIPRIRGRFRSVPREAVLAEARRLSRAGVLEVSLIAQDTTAWGGDLPGRPAFARLLRSLARIQGTRWIRILYAHPARLGDDVLAVLADEPERFVYLDLPLQHIEDRVLKRMGRRTTRAATMSLLERIRTRCPRIALRTTLLAGFPGETEREFEALRSFAASFPFDRLGVFPYSPEEGTPAARLPGLLPASERARRAREIRNAWRTRHLEANRARKGAVEEILIDAAGVREAVGRTWRDAPEIDGRVFLRGTDLKPGTFVAARILGTRGLDLSAEPVERHNSIAGTLCKDAK